MLIVLVMSAVAIAAGKPKEKTASAEATSIADQGSFGISINGHRVATEKFRIEQDGGTAHVDSELSYDDGTHKAAQTSKLELTAGGNLKRYEWEETSPTKSSIVVEPQDENFMVEHVNNQIEGPPKDVEHPLASNTTILDDNFFSQVELLAWRYLATSCTSAAGGLQCKLAPQHVPALIPHQQTSVLLEISYLGIQKIQTKNGLQDMGAFKIKSDDGEFTFWLDSNQKLARLVIPESNTVVTRD